MAFEVDDLQAAVDRLVADGYGPVGGIGQYEHTWRMAYVRGPEGIIVPWPSGNVVFGLAIRAAPEWVICASSGIPAAVRVGG